MKYSWTIPLGAIAIILLAGCSRKETSRVTPKAAAFGVTIVESSGGKQVAAVGSTLGQPVVVQVNDDQGNGVPGAVVEFKAAPGVNFEPASGLTDSSGQISTAVSLGDMAGRYEITAASLSKSQKRFEVKLQEIALGYQQQLGSQLSDKYCARCHDPESTPERVSNYDNLQVKPRAFTEGDTLNKMGEADLTSIISHGGPALNKSPLMPAYGFTLSKTEIAAIISYIRIISDPPYQASGLVYAQK